MLEIAILSTAVHLHALCCPIKQALYMALSREDCTQTDPAGPVYSNGVGGKVGLSFYLFFSLCVLEVAA